MILIVTSKRDGHVDAVAKHISETRVPWVRINIEDFATNVEVDVHPTKGAGRLFVKDSGKEVMLEDIGAVWYRKPDPVAVQHFEIGDPAALDYVEAEFNEVVHGLYALLDRAYWINNPLRTRIAHRKLLQLKTAAKVGFAVPQTIVTNRPAAALDFAHQVNGDLAIKSLGAICVTRMEAEQARQYGIFTRRITDNEMKEHRDKIGHMPTLFQEFIEKEAELRITCVGDEVFACEIRGRPGDVTNDDYRFDTPNLPHEAVERPDLTDRMHAYMKAFGLHFGCFDFIVPKGGGEPVFLEMNPNGQWLWVQLRTGQDIG
ncbi:MvdC/MvdD family ATP grasp protein [Mesorhizobium shangrilense]|uniref:MvdC/MvdD family ATP grasp protein n=1 Tax=Mesorhizobium shangrilense TaxID=460060 RepID=A0ABV2DIB0_9HYPH